MNTNPQVAIMMPVYNGEKTLPLAIASLIHQTYPYWKCYIVNDGSTDGTKELLDNLTDPRFVIIHFEKNQGRPYARQAALDAAEGKYLAFLDADDFYHQDKLKKQIKVFRENEDLALVTCSMGSYDAKFNLTNTRGGRFGKIRYRFTGRFNAPHAPSMVKLELAKKIDYNLKLKFAQDSDFFVRYLLNQYYFVIDDILYYYSEFDSVTVRKIIITYNYGIIRNFSFFKKYPFTVLKNISVLLTKLLFIFFSSPFINVKTILKRRGKPATKKERDMFNSQLVKIK